MDQGDGTDFISTALLDWEVPNFVRRPTGPHVFTPSSVVRIPMTTPRNSEEVSSLQRRPALAVNYAIFFRPDQLV